MNKIYLDFETRSLADLKAVGAAKYAADSSTDVLCIGYSVDGEVEIRSLIDPNHLDTKYGEFNAIWDFSADRDYIFISHGIFDQFIWQSVMVKKYGYPEIPIERWRCTM